MKIALIGRVAEGTPLYDGQTVKTRNMYNLLKNIDRVYLVDTYEYKRHFLRNLWKSIYSLCSCDVIILSLSINGRRFFFPFYYYLNKFFKRDIYYSSIGGRLAKNIEDNPKWKKYVKSFKNNWVENHELVNLLNLLGITNVRYLPNFKKINKVSLEKKYDYTRPFGMCIFSRIQKKKGVSEAIEAVSYINRKYGDTVVILDIYGPIDEDYNDEFKQLLSENDNCVEYKGVVDSSKSVDVLKDYYMLLFPTKYFNEGIPGTIIDAFASALPVIASNWHYCSEMITHKYNGLIYDFNDDNGLVNAIEYSINNVEEIIRMKENSLNKADEYMFENVLGMVREEITNNEELNK